MKLKDFMANLAKLVEKDPSIAEFTVVTAKDDEGNGFDEIHFLPSTGNYDQGDFEQSADNPNAICIN